MSERYRQITMEEYIGKPKRFENAGPIVNRQIEARSEEIDSVLEIVAHTYCLTVEQIIGPSRRRDISIARHMAGYLLYDQVGLSFRSSALSLGRNDHTTIMHSVDRVNDLLTTSPDFKEKIKSAKGMLADFMEAKPLTL